MAILGNLREKSGKWVAFAIGAALLLFLVSSLFSDQNFSMFGGDDDNNPVVMEVEGKEITQQEFDQIVGNYLKTRELNGMSVDESMRQQVRSQVANQLFNDLAVTPVLDKLGIGIAEKEIGELLTGADPHPYIRQYFGEQYSSERAKNFMQNDYQNDLKSKLAFDEYITAIKTQVRAEKYNKLVIAGMQASSFDAQVSYEKSSATVDAKMVFMNYLNIPDTMVSVSEGDMKSYLSKHEDDYKTEESRDLEYVVWDVKPNEQDSSEALSAVKVLVESFSNTEDDSMFVVRNSESDFDNGFRAHGSFGSAGETNIFNAEVGQVVGPLLAEGGYGIYKILDKKAGEQTYYNFSQIVIALGADSSALYDRAKQLMEEVNVGRSFEDVAKANSIDPSSVNGGYMGWVAEAPYIPVTIMNFLKNNGKGKMGIAQSDKGIHIIQINENQSNETVKVASVVKKIGTGRSSLDNVFGEANAFSSSIKTEDELDFTKKASDKGLSVKNATKLDAGAQGWPGLSNGRNIVKWAYESKRKEGDISQPFNVDDQLVVVRVRKLIKKGTSKLDDVREDVKTKVMNEKKAELLVDKFNDASKEAKDPVTLAVKLGTIAQSIDGAEFYKNTMLYVGSDYKVQGAVLGLKKGDRTKPIIGDQGVYVFFCENVSTPPSTMPDLEGRLASIQGQYRQGAESQIDAVLRKKAKLENNLAKYY